MADIMTAIQQTANGSTTPAAALTPMSTENTNPSAPDTSTITSNSLTPTTAIPFAAPAPTPIPSVASLETAPTPPLTETPGEQQASSLSQQLEDLNNQLVGKSAYQTQQNTAAGVDTLTKQQSDLSTQVTQLKNEALAIPNQLQLDATGRGITASGLAPIQTAALRNNSIQALSVSSLLDATNGLLASAQTKANQAVAAKYDPITEQINAATANLKLILADPQTTLDDKNRAQAQLDVQNQKAAQLATDKQNSTDVLNASITAAKNGADAATLQKMQAAPDGQSALQIATQAGYGTSDVNDLMTKYPDAQIQPGDTLAQAQQKVMQSPTYTLAQKSAMLDVATKEQALATAAANASPANINAAISQLNDYNGTKYYTSTDLQGMDAKTKQAFVNAAIAAGAQAISPKDADAMSAINAAQSDLSSFNDFITMGGDGGKAVLPTNWLGQPQQLADVTLNKYLQTNNQLGAFNTWKLSVIPALSALKGAGSGGSGGAARLFTTIGELFPTDTDTVATAQAKIDHINTLLDNAGKSIVGTSNSYNGVTLPGSTGSSTYNGITLPN